MKKITILLVAFLTSALFTNISAQSADDIIDNYFENTGGIEAWRSIEGMKILAKANQGGMEIPVTIVQLKNGKQMTSISFQGKEIKQGVFDGETLWSTNFMTQKAEKSDAETTANMKLQMEDFPDPFLDYEEKGYSVELVGKEDYNGTETFKIKLTKKPMTVDGNEEENISFYFFDAENFVPIAIHSEIKQGQAKGMISEVTFSDYDEVEGGIYMPFTMTNGIKGQPGQAITMEKYELNPTVDNAEFEFPKEETTTEENEKN